MPLVHRIQIRTTGFPGGPGFTSLHFAYTGSADDVTQYTAVKNLLGNVAGAFPSIWTAQIEPSNAVLDEVTGELNDFTSPTGATGDPQNGTNGASYGSNVSGACTAVQTNTINRGRKVRGRIFWVPLAAPQYQSDGTLTASTTTDLNAIVAALRTDSSSTFGIWSRPRLSLGGKFAPATGHRTADTVAFLSSRRT